MHCKWWSTTNGYAHRSRPLCLGADTNAKISVGRDHVRSHTTRKATNTENRPHLSHVHAPKQEFWPACPRLLLLKAEKALRTRSTACICITSVDRHQRPSFYTQAHLLAQRTALLRQFSLYCRSDPHFGPSCLVVSFRSRDECDTRRTVDQTVADQTP